MWRVLSTFIPLPSLQRILDRTLILFYDPICLIVAFDILESRVDEDRFLEELEEVFEDPRLGQKPLQRHATIVMQGAGVIIKTI